MNSSVMFYNSCIFYRLARLSGDFCLFPYVFREKTDVPRRTSGNMRKNLLFLTLILVLGCEKPNPTPELADAIYQDLNSQAESAGKAAEAEKKKLEGLKKELSEAKPQTGDTKVVQKRYFEAERKVQQFLQEQFYYSLRAKTRKSEVRRSYAAAFSEQKPYDNEDETKSFETYKKVSQPPGSWDAKRRIANYTKETGFGAPAGQKIEKPEKPASKGH
jgi:hypothetical protein